MGWRLGVIDMGKTVREYVDFLFEESIKQNKDNKELEKRNVLIKS